MRRWRGVGRRDARWPAAVVVAALLTAVGCTGDEPSAPDAPAEPPQRAGEVVRVDVCDLVRRATVRRLLGRPVRVVGRRLDPPTLPTETCQWGQEFAVSLLEVRLTPGPVARDTFDAAFGPAAGDDAREVDVGEVAYARSGLTSRTLQSFQNGAVLSLDARDTPGRRLPRRALPGIASAILRDLPANPALRHGRPPRACVRVQRRAVGAAMDARVRALTGHSGGAPDEAARPVMCSWAGLPGNVVVTVRTDPVQVTNFRANLSPRVYERVRRVRAEAWSQNDHAGDLLLFLDDALIEVEVLPGQGFSAPDVVTTPGEVRLANALVRAFGT